MFAFGSGVLSGTRTDVANATPFNFGLVQEGAARFLQFTAKELYGQFSFSRCDRARPGQGDPQGQNGADLGSRLQQFVIWQHLGERPARDLVRRDWHGTGH